VDVALTLAVAAFTQLEIIGYGWGVEAELSAAVCTVPLLFRRRAPLVACLSIVAAGVVVAASGETDHLTEGLFPLPAATLAVYSVALYAAWPRAVLGASAALLGVWLAGWWAAGFQILAFLDLTAVWIVGRMARAYRRRSDRLGALAAALEREGEATARLTAMRERADIARDVHEVTADAVSLMVVQAAAAESVLATAPADCRRALANVQDAGRNAMSELRRTVGILRDGGEHVPPDEPSVVPTPRATRRRPALRWSETLDLVAALASSPSPSCGRSTRAATHRRSAGSVPR
jgi:signal transduction histidine kinase